MAGIDTLHWFSGFALDMRNALLTFSTRTGFAGATVLTLAVGIGATTAIFSVVHGVLLKPLPFDEPDRLVTLRHHAPHGVGTNHGPASYLTYQENQQAFDAIGGWDATDVSISGAGTPERVEALLVTASTLPLLRIHPVAGRLFTPDDDAPGQPLRVILTHGLWQRRFGGAGDVVGRQFDIDGQHAEVIGILPESFTFLRTQPAILLPLPIDLSAPRNISFGMQALARLKPGITIELATADVSRLIGMLPPAFATLELRPNVQPLAADVVGDVREILWILLVAVGAVLLIATANVANLFLVRTEGRHHEFALRAALGASRGRLARALLTESVVLALAGGIVGLGLAAAATAVLRRIAPAQLPRVNDIGLDPLVLLFTLSISVLAGLLFGLVAVLRFGRPSVGGLREGGRSVGGGPTRQRTRHVLVIGQVALALVLLIVSGLMTRTVIAMRQVHPGFEEPAHVQTFAIAIPASLVADPEQAALTHRQIAERLVHIPGVSSVGLSSSITMDGEDNGNQLMVEQFPDREGSRSELRRFKSIGPGYFETMGNSMVAGRAITWNDIFDGRLVIVISDRLARQYWADPSEALGKRVRCCGERTPWREIVGVSGNERDDGLAEPPTPIVYYPMLNESYRWRTMVYAVRSDRAGSAPFVRELETAVRSVDADLPLARVQTLADIQTRSMTRTSFAMVMLGMAAAAALLIGMVGIYGVVSYAVTQRTREIGVRMALGARGDDVRRMFVVQGLAVTATGVVVGLAMSIAITRMMASFLFGVSALDPVTFALVSASLAGMASLAAYLPARRASRVNPLVALRAQG